MSFEPSPAPAPRPHAAPVPPSWQPSGGWPEATSPHPPPSPGRPGDGSAASGAPTPAARRRGRAAVVVLAVLLVAALGLAAYLWLAADRWRAASGEWESKARAHAQQVAELDARLAAATGELAASREQLATATQRITDLANEKAQLGDENVASQQYLDYQRRVSEAAGVVASALGQCTSGQSQLIEYLREPEAYDPADLDRFGQQVADLCARANEANASLQQELQQ